MGDLLSSKDIEFRPQIFPSVNADLLCKQQNPYCKDCILIRQTITVENMAQFDKKYNRIKKKMNMAR